MSSTANNAYPIYYYRGNVQNNHLIFGGFCWKIVRTTDTGGTKLIYDGIPNNGQCTSTDTATQINSSTYPFNTNANSIAYAGYKYGSTHPSVIYTSSSVIDSLGTIVYGNDVEYKDGKYKLIDTVYYSNYSEGLNSSNGIQYHHYTCFSSSNLCSKVYYINQIYEGDTVFYYYSLENSETHLTLLDKMLNNDGSIPSNAYTQLTTWYRNNLVSDNDKIEDTVFCNDRSIYDYGGWDINKSNTSVFLFGAYGRLVDNKSPSLVCQNPGDRYTVSKSNGNGQLEYPIGLLTADEYVLAGAKYSSSNSSFYLYNEKYHYAMTPYYYDYNTGGYHLRSDGTMHAFDISANIGLRAVVSLSKDVTIMCTDCDGTSTHPYIVE